MGEVCQNWYIENFKYNIAILFNLFCYLYKLLYLCHNETNYNTIAKETRGK